MVYQVSFDSGENTEWYFVYGSLSEALTKGKELKTNLGLKRIMKRIKTITKLNEIGYYHTQLDGQYIIEKVYDVYYGA